MKAHLTKLLPIPCILACILFAGIISPNIALAKVEACDSSLPYEVLTANGCDSNGSTEDDFPNLIIGILNSIIAISGLVAVVFIVIGGIKFMTSAGDAGKVSEAKRTILYAVIGLIICTLAFVIINFVISNILQPSITGETI